MICTLLSPKLWGSLGTVPPLCVGVSVDTRKEGTRYVQLIVSTSGKTREPCEGEKEGNLPTTLFPIQLCVPRERIISL